MKYLAYLLSALNVFAGYMNLVHGGDEFVFIAAGIIFLIASAVWMAVGIYIHMGKVDL